MRETLSPYFIYGDMQSIFPQTKHILSMGIMETGLVNFIPICRLQACKRIFPNRNTNGVCEIGRNVLSILSSMSLIWGHPKEFSRNETSIIHARYDTAKYIRLSLL